MAQLRDLFTQSGGEASELEREEPPPRADQLGQEHPPEEKSSELPLFSERNSKPEGSSFDAASLETCNVPILDTVNDTSSAHDYTSNSKPEHSESFNLATLPGAEGAADVRVEHPDDAPAGCQDINKLVTKAEDNTQVMSCVSTGNIEAEPADSIISAVGSESLASMAHSFTFGTVLVPLCKQVFGRAGSESQSVCDWGNPVQATQNTADLIQSCPHSNKREISGTVPTNAGGYKDKVLGNLTTTQESKQECSHTSPTHEERSSINERENDILDHGKTLQGPEILSDQTTNTSLVPETGLGDTVVPLRSENTLNTDLSNPQTTTERLHLQGEAQEHDVTLDPQSTAERAQAPLAEHACAQIKTALSETHVQSAKEVMTSQEISCESLQTQIVSECVSNETNQQTSSRGSNGLKCVTQTSHEESHNMEEENKEGVINYFMHGDKSYTVKCKQTEHHEIRAAGSGYSADTASCWEMMVQEEETNILTDEEECKAISSKIEDAEVAEKDQGEHMEDAEIETASENIETTEEEKGETDVETVDRITAARQKENKAQDSSQEKTWEEKEQATRRTREVERAAELMKKEETVLEKEKHSAETHEVNIETVNVPEEKEIDINLINSDKAIGEWEDLLKVRDDNVEEGNPDYMEEILVDGTSEVVDAELEGMTTGGSSNEVGCLEERLDITQAKDRNDFSAPVNDVQGERKPDKENTGEVQSATATDEGPLHKEEAFSNIVHDIHDQSKPEIGETAASEAHSCVLADEPESHDSTSAESDSDDEVELYMHCLRAVHSGARAHKDKSRDAFPGAAFPVSRSKLMSEPMPSITESVDEEQPPVHLQGGHEDTDTADIQAIVAALPLSCKQGNTDTNVSWWEESFSCSNITKMLFYASLFIIFVVVASYYDFLACFGLYVISLIWLCCHGERQPVKNNRLD